jgi:nitroimidazol reductase NimA-like FMN-containing flavoprotein (pyridoxamine 5'-phosphate oxidase superfamily)
LALLPIESTRDDGHVNDDHTPPSSLPVDRTGVEIIPFLDCEQLLERSGLGRVAMIVAGEPVILPVNYRYVNGCVVFRSATGEKVSTASMRGAMSFEIDAMDLEQRTGWSVLLKGTGDLIDDDDPMALAAADLQPWSAPDQRDIWVRIVPMEITGRRIGPATTD